MTLGVILFQLEYSDCQNCRELIILRTIFVCVRQQKYF